MLYFAYAAHLNPAHLTPHAPGHKTVGVARLTGHRLIFPRYSRVWNGATASVAASADDVVFGALYELSPDDVPVLHYHQGYDPSGPPELNEHVFREIAVRRVGLSEPVSAWTYLAVPDNSEALPSRDYLTAMVDGARYHGLPRAYIAVLSNVRTA
jgi:hypothetical protein